MDWSASLEVRNAEAQAQASAAAPSPSLLGWGAVGGERPVIFRGRFCSKQKKPTLKSNVKIIWHLFIWNFELGSFLRSKIGFFVCWNLWIMMDNGGIRGILRPYSDVLAVRLGFFGFPEVRRPGLFRELLSQRTSSGFPRPGLANFGRWVLGHFGPYSLVFF